MGHFSNVSGKSVTGGGAYFPDGRHRVKILSTKVNSGHKGTFAIVECEVLETDQPDPKLCRPGDKRSHVINLGDKEMGPIHIKAFVLAASGLEPTSNDEKSACEFWTSMLDAKVQLTFEEVCDRLFDEDAQLLADQVADLRCVVVKTKKGNDFTKHFWEPFAW